MTITIEWWHVAAAIAAVPVSLFLYFMLADFLLWTVGIRLPGTGPSSWMGW